MILDIRGLQFSYRSAQVLAEVTFRLGGHEVVAICGPNGAGKTTLLRCVNAILLPQCGDILIEGVELSRLSRTEIARKIGYVAQHAEMSRTTVFDSILLGRRPHISLRVKEHDLRVVNAAIERLHLEDLSLRYIDELSGGEFQKVCIARAIVQEPRVLLLDEPTSNLDLKNQIEILKLVREVTSGHDMAAVMTMHDLNMALHYADHLIFLKKGTVHEICTPGEVTGTLIEEIYGVAVRLEKNNGYPIIIPVEIDGGVRDDCFDTDREGREPV